MNLAKAEAEQSAGSVEIDLKAIIGELEKLLLLANDEGKLKLAGEAMQQRQALPGIPPSYGEEANAKQDRRRRRDAGRRGSAH